MRWERAHHLPLVPQRTSPFRNNREKASMNDRMADLRVLLASVAERLELLAEELDRTAERLAGRATLPPTSHTEG